MRRWTRRAAVLAALIALARWWWNARRARSKWIRSGEKSEFESREHGRSGKVSTVLAHAGCQVDSSTGALTPPIHMSSTFERDADNEYRRTFIYGRVGNPTRALLESALAAAECGTQACTFASGSAAAAAIFQALPGGVVLIPDDLYHGNRFMLQSVFSLWGLQYEAVDMTDIDAVQASVNDAKAKSQEPENIIVWTETPSNPLLKVTDVKAVSRLTRALGVAHIVDATWMTPALCQPLNLGCDLVLHSTTKYLGGHSDLLGGAIVCGETDLGNKLFARVRHIQGSIGAVPSPFDCWLTLRGMRSLSARMPLHSYNALQVAKFLEQHPMVEQVFYPGLESHPAHSLAASQFGSQFGGMLSFLVKGGEATAIQLAAAVQVFKRATSLGGTESLIEHRHSIEAKPSLTPTNLLRVSVGLESITDLIEDLDKALASI